MLLVGYALFYKLSSADLAVTGNWSIWTNTLLRKTDHADAVVCFTTEYILIWGGGQAKHRSRKAACRLLLPVNIAHLVFLVLHAIYKNFLVHAHVLHNKVRWGIWQVAPRRVTVGRVSPRFTLLCYLAVLAIADNSSAFWCIFHYGGTVTTGAEIRTTLGVHSIGWCSSRATFDKNLVFWGRVIRQYWATCSVIELLYFLGDSSTTHEAFLLLVGSCLLLLRRARAHLLCLNSSCAILVWIYAISCLIFI